MSVEKQEKKMTIKKSNPINRAKLSNLLAEKRNGIPVREFMRDYQEHDIAPHAWRAWESGETRPTTDNLIKLANFFNLPVEDFLKLIETQEDEVIPFKYPLREYNKRQKTAIQSNQISLASVLTEEEKKAIGFRLLCDISVDKKEIIYSFLKQADIMAEEFGWELLSQYQGKKTELLKKAVKILQLTADEKINFATSLLTEVTAPKLN